jgi:ATP-binding cassette subfamily F protein uup
MDQVASHILAFHRGSDGSNELVHFTGYLQWEEWFEEQKILDAEKLKEESAKASKGSAKPVKLSFKEKFELENMEATIHGLEAKMEQLQAETAKPEVMSNAGRLQELYAEIGKTQSSLDQNYARWAELEKKANGG